MLWMPFVWLLKAIYCSLIITCLPPARRIDEQLMNIDTWDIWTVDYRCVGYMNKGFRHV